jgi:hypothetical protein
MEDRIWMSAREREEPIVLVAMIDDAMSRVLARFYEGETVEAYMDLLGRWLLRAGSSRGGLHGPRQPPRPAVLCKRGSADFRTSIMCQMAASLDGKLECQLRCRKPNS